MQCQPASAADVRRLALEMPYVTVGRGTSGNPIYRVGGKSFIFFRNPLPDAVDPGTGEPYTDVIVFWVGSEEEKQTLVGDPASPFFTTSHFDGHTSVLLRSSRVAEVSRQKLTQVVQGAWLSRAQRRRAEAWSSEHVPG